MILRLSGFFLAALTLLASPANAQCQQMLDCCLQTVGAHEERGLSGRRLTEAVQTCHVYEGLSTIPAAQAVFCIESLMIISESAWEDFQAGRIGFYPDACMADPVDLDAELIPDEDFEE